MWNLHQIAGANSTQFLHSAQRQFRKHKQVIVYQSKKHKMFNLSHLHVRFSSEVGLKPTGGKKNHAGLFDRKRKSKCFMSDGL